VTIRTRHNFWSLCLVGTISALLPLLVVCGADGLDPPQILVVFRYDDCSARSPFDIDCKVIEAFREIKASVTFGVIPYVCAGDVHDPSPQDVVPLPQARADVLKSAAAEGVLDVQLHGFAHQVCTAGELRSEFAGRDFDNQVEMISRGRSALEKMIGVRITCFIPPWNSYDLHTLHALEKLGFSTISAAPGGPAAGGTALRFLPATCELPDLRDAVRLARNSGESLPVIVVLFHPYDFPEFDPVRATTTHQEFRDLLAWLRTQQDVRVVSISQTADLVSDLTADRLLLNRRVESASQLLPPFLRLDGAAPRLVYITSGRTWTRLWMRVGAFYSAVAAFGTIVVAALARWPRVRGVCFGPMGRLSLLAVAAATLVYAFHDFGVNYHYRRTALGALFLGASLGTWLWRRRPLLELVRS